LNPSQTNGAITEIRRPRRRKGERVRAERLRTTITTTAAAATAAATATTTTAAAAATQH